MRAIASAAMADTLPNSRSSNAKFDDVRSIEDILLDAIEPHNEFSWVDAAKGGPQVRSRIACRDVLRSCAFAYSDAANDGRYSRPRQRSTDLIESSRATHIPKRDRRRRLQRAHRSERPRFCAWHKIAKQGGDHLAKLRIVDYAVRLLT